MNIFISETGEVRFIYGDELAAAMKDVGEARTARASHVEPAQTGGWEADMNPVGGPKLGPFATRQEALEEEIAWLEKHQAPSPIPARSAKNIAS